MTYSFLGWCLEVICKLISDHKFINRGFLIGPYCPIYGWGTLLMQLLLQKYLNDPLVLFIMIILLCSILEYFTSFYLEKLFHTRWWDYSNKKFNINGRICLETMVPFGIFGMFLMYVANPFFLNLFNSWNETFTIVLASILVIGLLIDTIISFKMMNTFKNLCKNIEQKQIIPRDDTERIKKLVKKQIQTSKMRLEKRIMDAFPHLKIQTWNKTKKKKTKKESCQR